MVQARVISLVATAALEPAIQQLGQAPACVAEDAGRRRRERPQTALARKALTYGK